VIERDGENYKNGEMILADKDIKEVIESGKLGVEPFIKECVQPSSLDLHLEKRVRVFDNYGIAEIDVREKVDVTRVVEIPESGFVLHPGEFILGSTEEYFKFPSDLAGQINGKSSLGRLGLIIHATAGFFDPGFEGAATLEIANVSRLPIRLYAGMKIAQMVFFRMTQEVETPYGSEKLGSKYSGQRGPTASMGYLNFKKK
jgi:dCTP deaminase